MFAEQAAKADADRAAKEAAEKKKAATKKKEKKEKKEEEDDWLTKIKASCIFIRKDQSYYI